MAGELVTKIEIAPETLAVIRKWNDVTRSAFKERVARMMSRRALLTAAKASRYARQRLNVRTGILSNSIIGAVIEIGGAPAMRIGFIKGPVAKYGGLQELGTQGRNPTSPFDDLRSKKRGGFLAVPTADGDALTPAGVARYPSASDFPDELTFVRPGKGKLKGRRTTKTYYASAMLVRTSDLEKDVETRNKSGNRRGIRSRVVAQYLLFRQVTIPPTYFMRDAVVEALPELSNDVAEVVRSLIDE